MQNKIIKYYVLKIKIYFQIHPKKCVLIVNLESLLCRSYVLNSFY